MGQAQLERGHVGLTRPSPVYMDGMMLERPLQAGGMGHRHWAVFLRPRLPASDCFGAVCVPRQRADSNAWSCMASLVLPPLGLQRPQLPAGPTDDSVVEEAVFYALDTAYARSGLLMSTLCVTLPACGMECLYALWRW